MFALELWIIIISDLLSIDRKHGTLMLTQIESDYFGFFEGFTFNFVGRVSRVISKVCYISCKYLFNTFSFVHKVHKMSGNIIHDLACRNSRTTPSPQMTQLLTIIFTLKSDEALSIYQPLQSREGIREWFFFSLASSHQQVFIKHLIKQNKQNYFWWLMAGVLAELSGCNRFWNTHEKLWKNFRDTKPKAFVCLMIECVNQVFTINFPLI